MTEPEESRHVARTIRAMEMLAEAPCSQAEIARELDAHPRTVQRLLGRLVAEGYARRANSERREYSATLKLVMLAGKLIARLDIVREALPFVSRLAELAGETTQLCVPGEIGAIAVADNAGSAQVSVKTHLGDVLPYHATAAGKALLAHLPRQLDTTLAVSLESFTDTTIVDRADLLVELATIREQGFAVEDCEHGADVRGAAAPVFGHTGDCAGALAIRAPANRLSREMLPSAGERVAGVARELSVALGFDPARDNPPEATGSTGGTIASAWQAIAEAAEP